MPKSAALIGPKTRVIDLKGRTATPGLIDTHAHIVSTGIGELFEIRLGETKSVTEMVAALKARVASTPKGEWITGVGWDEGKFADGKYPTAADLDAVSPDNPVWLENTTGHYGVANSAALKLAGVTAATKTPPAGTIERLPDGRPAGVMKEAAQEMVTSLIPPASVAQRQAALAHMIKRLHAEGMTGFKDPSIGPHDWAAYRNLVAAGGLDINACVLFSGGRTLASATKALGEIRSAKGDIAGANNGSLAVCGVKLFLDGSGAAPTAWMYADWNRQRTEIATGNSGYPQIDPAEYQKIVAMFVNADIGIGTHAIGDRAIDWTVDTYAEALKAHPTQGPAPQHHPRQHAHRSRHRHHGGAAEPPMARAIPNRRRALPGGSAISMPPISAKRAASGSTRSPPMPNAASSGAAARTHR